MSNNMDLGYEMFCYQCEQTANGKGCTRLGVCGKTPEIANLQDLLIFQLKGISCYGKVLIEKGQHIDKDIVRFVENCLFTTLTNVNFDADVHVSLLRESQQIKEKLREVVGEIKNHTLHATYNLPENNEKIQPTESRCCKHRCHHAEHIVEHKCKYNTDKSEKSKINSW
jgi:hydroxylamine reductase